ncbi:MAG: flagellar hook-basal body complex protein FliE [Oscillospiraceae bacterium]|nr:flagellar hook-basal body complex protein FliE [Oscillospiraceae bacterium]
MENFALSIQPIQKLNFSKIGETEGSTDSSSQFLNILKDAVNDYASLQQTTDSDNASLALGDVDNLAQLQINSLKAEAALQTTVQLTSRAVNAYKEIMQMSV